jgi:twitching motility protein PilT
MMGIQTYVSCYANSAVETLDNFVSVFSSEEKSWITRTLSNSLKAVINQRVLPGIAGRPVVAFELLLPTPEVRKAIREENFDGIAEALKKDQAKTGMITLNQSLMNLLVKRKVELKNAFEASPDPDELDQLLKKAGL